jgi:uncharacterized membrane protein YhaH (DUF805 family)
VLDKLFSFRGRLSRLQFLGWTIALAVIFTVGTVVLVTTGVVSGQMLHARSSPGAIGLAAGLAMLILYLWSGLALQVKRIRDIGLSPLLVIVGLMIFSFIDGLILSRYLHFRLWPFQHQATISGLVNLAFMGMLLFWPGEGDDDAPRAAPRDVAPMAPQPSVPRPTISMSLPQPGAARREFGLRTR